MKTVASASPENFSIVAPNGARFVASKTTKPGLIRLVSARVAAAEELWKKEAEKRDAKKMAAYLRIRERYEKQELNRNRAAAEPEVTVEAVLAIPTEENEVGEQTPA